MLQIKITEKGAVIQDTRNRSRLERDHARAQRMVARLRPKADWLKCPAALEMREEASGFYDEFRASIFDVVEGIEAEIRGRKEGSEL